MTGVGLSKRFIHFADGLPFKLTFEQFIEAKIDKVGLVFNNNSVILKSYLMLSTFQKKLFNNKYQYKQIILFIKKLSIICLKNRLWCSK